MVVTRCNSSFNEAAAMTPRKKGAVDAAVDVAGAVGFNEAAAMTPRKKPRRHSIEPAHFSFNEAAAMTPRKN